MNVIYRGVTYETEMLQVEVTETGRTALFLGNRFKVKQYNATQRQSLPLQLKYRGASYSA